MNKSWGIEVNGATRWLKFPGLPQFQVADVVKTCMIIFIAAYISSKWREMDKFKTIIILWLVVGAEAVFLYKVSNNLSSALVVLGICYLCTFITSKNWKLHLVVLILFLLVAAGLIGYVVTHLPTQDELKMMITTSVLEELLDGFTQTGMSWTRVIRLNSRSMQ